MTESGSSSAKGPAPAYAARTKYDEPGRAGRYERRSAKRHAEEWRLLARLLDDVPAGSTVLDVPCGTGRVAAEMLARGIRVRCADLSPTMRERARANLDGKPGFLGVEALDLDAPTTPSATPIAERADAVVCFRFLHHLPDTEARVRVLRALAARSRGPVVLSFHHVASVHQVARAFRRVVTGRRGDRHATTLAGLRRDAAAAGLRVVRARALLPFLRDLWVARLEPVA